MMQWNLIRLRNEAGLTQVYMANLLGIGKDAYSNKETGKNQFKTNEMFIIRDLFQTPMDIIFLPPNSIITGA